MADYLDLADWSWPLLSRLMRAHAAIYRATVGGSAAEFPVCPPCSCSITSGAPPAGVVILEPR